MTWSDGLRRVTLPDGRSLIGGSFRGVAFFVESVERSGGRRAVVHEFPFRNDPFVEDLGRGARGYRIEAYVLGDDYVDQRDALLSACEDNGNPGELVLPSYPTTPATCVKYGVRESKADGRISVLSLEFAEAPTQAPAPSEVVDAPAQVATAADAAIVATQAELEEQYSTDGLPAFALESAETALINASEAIAAKLAPLVEESQELAEFTGRIALITAEAASLVRQPADVLVAFVEAFTGLVSTIEAAPGAVMEALFDAYSADLGQLVVATTSTRSRELTNQTALIAALRRVMAIEACRLAPLVSYVSVEEAAAARDRALSLLDEQAAIAGDTAYPAITDLGAEVGRAVPGGSAFAHIVTISRSAAIPSLLLAYQLYGSVDLEADILARNAIDHPGFVGGDLKVLSNG